MIDWRINLIVFYSRRKAKLVSWCPGMMYFPVVCFTILGLCVHIHTLELEIGMLFLCVPQVKERHIFEAWAFCVGPLLFMRSGSKYWRLKFSNRISYKWTWTTMSLHKKLMLQKCVVPSLVEHIETAFTLVTIDKSYYKCLNCVMLLLIPQEIMWEASKHAVTISFHCVKHVTRLIGKSGGVMAEDAEIREDVAILCDMPWNKGMRNQV